MCSFKSTKMRHWVLSVCAAASFRWFGGGGGWEGFTRSLYSLWRHHRHPDTPGLWNRSDQVLFYNHVTKIKKKPDHWSIFCAYILEKHRGFGFIEFELAEVCAFKVFYFWIELLMTQRMDSENSFFKRYSLDKLYRFTKPTRKTFICCFF